MARISLRLAVGTLAIAAAACSNKVRIEDGTGGGKTTSTTSTTTSTNTTATGSTTSSSTGGMCAAYDDAPDQAKVTVRFRNDSGFPIYLPAKCGVPTFQIDQGGGAPDNVSYSYGGQCLQTCEDRQTQPPIDCPACPPSAFLLNVGETRDFEWNRTGLLGSQTMPASCYFDTPTQFCSQIIKAPDAMYVFSASGNADCSNPMDGSCNCDPMTGKCDGEATGNTAYSDAGKITLPADNLVEVVFGTCAFPCPNP